MKWLSILALVLVASAIAQDETVPEAEECDPEVCVLPNCRCSGTDIPGGLAPRDTPQFVTVTFDDGINVNNILTYRSTLFNRVNSNGCRAGATFFVSHEYTNYQIVNELYNHGFEIALHSITHQVPQTYWAQATVETMEREFGDQRIQMAHFANIPMEAIKGVRIPFLQMTGEASFQVMAKHNLAYDCTWPTIANRDPGLWPYTLDYRSTQDCIVPPCPTGSHPGVWVKPIVAWTDLNGVPCSFVDACANIPSLTNEDEWYKFILTNFERHYMGNRAPFGFFVHEAFLSVNPAVRAAFVRFLDTINNLNDTFMVTANEVIDWVKNPVPIDEYRRQPCRSFLPRNCVPSSCGNLESSHTTMRYWMQICNVCPRVYPWLNNPLGL